MSKAPKTALVGALAGITTALAAQTLAGPPDQPHLTSDIAQ